MSNSSDLDHFERHREGLYRKLVSKPSVPTKCAPASTLSVYNAPETTADETFDYQPHDPRTCQFCQENARSPDINAIPRGPGAVGVSMTLMAGLVCLSSQQ